MLIKYSVIALATFAAVASARFTLRSTANKYFGYGSTIPENRADARVIVHGMKHEASLEDLDIISQAIVAAYNHAYDIVGYTMDSFTPHLTAPVPDNVGWTPDCRFCPDDDAIVIKDTNSHGQLVLAAVQVGWTPDCRFCPDDDAHLSANIVELHSKFEHTLCATLRTSGSSNLADARDCSFSFLDMPGQSDQNLPIHARESYNSGHSTEGQVLLYGMLHDFSEKDYELIETNIVSAYNEAFTSAGYRFQAFETVADIDMPDDWKPDCRFCPDDDTATVMAAKLVVARVMPIGWSPNCRFCSPDDDAAATVLESLNDEQLTHMYNSFEKAFCHKLRTSGSANFAQLVGCSFRFIHNSIVESAEVAQK